MKVYLAGPMRGYPRFNFDAFEDATQKLRDWGYEVVSPHNLDLETGFDPAADHKLDEKGVPVGFSLKDCVRRDVEAILTCDGVVLLPGWDRSRGARAEKAIAEWLGIDVLYFSILAVRHTGKPPEPTRTMFDRDILAPVTPFKGILASV